MAAPGGLLMAKLIFPDDPAEPPETREENVMSSKKAERPSRHANVIMAAGVGAFPTA